ncbi:MAG: hypothetical protein K2N64_03435 [Anaeroplasmataceae bacterium]|nr:hypothetical protein [Anaeroplasmataceae bacterium]
MKKNIKLDDYFCCTRYALFYFDIQIKKLYITKEALLKELSIPYMSYRRSKEENTNIGKKIIYKLEQYFKMNSVNSSKKVEYEDLLNQILTRFYYRGENLQEFEPVLEKCIEENTYMKPIFQLFALLIRMASNKSIESIAQEEYACFQELLPYKKHYYISPFVELLVMLEISFSGDRLIEFDKDIYFSEEMKGLVYYSYNANAYLAKRFDLCLYYAKECKSYLIKDSNYKRIITLNLSYFACLNYIGEYHKCMKEARAQLFYLYESYPNTDLVYFTEIHYYTACLGAKNYKEVIEEHIHKEDYNCYDYVFLFLATFHYDKKLFKELTRKYKNEAEHTEALLEKYKSLIENLISYLTTKKKAYYLDKINRSELNIGVKDIILKFY